MSDANRLYFRLVRTGRVSALGTTEDMFCGVGNHYTKQDIYSAVSIGFSKTKHMDIEIVKSCIVHVPIGSWVEGRDKSTMEPSPAMDRLARIIERKYKL